MNAVGLQKSICPPPDAALKPSGDRVKTYWLTFESY